MGGQKVANFSICGLLRKSESPVIGSFNGIDVVTSQSYVPLSLIVTQYDWSVYEAS